MNVFLCAATTSISVITVHFELFSLLAASLVLSQYQRPAMVLFNRRLTIFNFNLTYYSSLDLHLDN